jgi:hypothetical protein
VWGGSVAVSNLKFTVPVSEIYKTVLQFAPRLLINWTYDNIYQERLGITQEKQTGIL